MKANELMIGDWVHCITDNDNVQIGRLNTKDSYITEWSDLYADYDDKVNTLSDVEPVPITEEILEKNGLNVRTEDEDGVELSLLSRDYRVMYHFGYQWAYVIVKDEITFGCKILYVHELQHALRLGKLNELADNFKVKTMESELIKLFDLISYWKQMENEEYVASLKDLLKTKFKLSNSRIRKKYQETYNNIIEE